MMRLGNSVGARAAGPAPRLRRRAGLSSAARAMWCDGEPAGARAYLAEHPELAGDADLLCELAYEEYFQRLEAGEDLDLAAYCAHFPECAAALEEVIGAHRAMNAYGDVIDACPVTVWPEAGDTFQGFVLRRELGRGTFGRVFLAEEPALGEREVVVKVSEGGAVEAETLGRLRHANIVPVHSVHEDAVTGLTAICMPYLGSTTLDDVLDRVAARGRVPERAAFLLDAAGPGAGPAPDGILRHGSYAEGVLHLGALLAAALKFLHEQGIFHQDLKPSNVLLAPGGRPMLLDFNLSRGGGHGPLGGTVPYMAPEQLRATAPAAAGAAEAVGAPADVFALGVVLYELLTGKHPFGPLPAAASDKDRRAVLLGRQAQGAPALREQNPHIPAALARAVERCLAFDPAARGSAGELSATLRHHLTVLRRSARRLAAALPAAARAAVLLLAAAATVTAGVATRDADATRHAERGQAALRQGDLRHAVEAFSRALDAAPNLYAARVGRARAYQRLRRFEDALGDWEKADALAADGQVRACRAFCLTELGRHKAAVVHYRRAREAGYGTAAVLNDLGFSLCRLYQFDEAQVCLEEAARLAPGQREAHHNLALCDYQRALADPTETYVPLVGIESVQTLFALPPGPARAVAYRDAAHLYNVAAERAPSPLQHVCVERGLAAVAQAVAQGCATSDLRGDAGLRYLRRDARFAAIVAGPAAPVSAVRFLPLLDPLDTLSD